MKGIHQTVKRTLTPKGRIPSQHLSEVKESLNKLSPPCKSITDHLPCANPSLTIRGLKLMKHPKHGVNTLGVTPKANIT
jgi:hypothetical protein